MSIRNVTFRSHRHVPLAASILTCLVAAPLHAATGSASAADVNVNVNVLGVAQLDVDPQVPVGFDNAVEPTHQQDSLPTLDYGGAVIHLSTGVVSTEADYEPEQGFAGAGASVRIEDFDLSALSLLGDGLVSLGANTIQTTSLVTGYCLPSGRTAGRSLDLDDITFYNGFDAGNLDPGGPAGTDRNVVFDGLHLSVLGVDVPDLPTNPAPNTAIDLASLGIIGATLVLNEQAIGGDGIMSSSIATNALHFSIDSVGLITSDVVLARSESQLSCAQ